MNNPKTLTNAYLYQLAQTDIDSMAYTKIVTALQDVDTYTTDSSNYTRKNRMKAILIDKLCSIPGVDKVSILNESGYQISNLDMRANGAGPVTILIVDEAGEGK